MKCMEDLDELFSSQALELRRGTIVLATLSCLKQPHYGYALLERLKAAGITVDAGTLYPLLRRLEKQGALESSWDTSDSRPRKYYQLSQPGVALYGRLLAEWSQISTNLAEMVRKENT